MPRATLRVRRAGRGHALLQDERTLRSYPSRAEALEALGAVRDGKPLPEPSTPGRRANANLVCGVPVCEWAKRLEVSRQTLYARARKAGLPVEKYLESLQDD